ncbi:MAG TPA: ComEC/Rec2 family competence protein [Solirubrobacterales bacterium]
MASGRPTPLLLLAVAAIVALAIAHSGEIGARADASLGRGMPAREAELARGFVLGEDDRIDPRTVEDFRRSGLSHLLAVSGQNVALLALLAMPVLGALGIPLRARLVWVLALIAVYVPLTGAGPSIQRAGVMGALSVLATLAGRRASRLYALAVAAIVTLAIEPRIAADVGWQLSFAAVVGILLLSAPLRRAIGERIGSRGLAGALAEGAALTIAATLATAPLIAFHFGAVSTTTLAANLLALPAVAPAMWLGMLAAAAGQVPGLPVAPINALNAPLLAYIAQVAAWCGRPSWAYLEVRVGLGGLLASYALIAALALFAQRLGRSRRIAAARRRREPRPPRRGGGRNKVALAALAALLLWAAVGGGDGGGGAPPARGLRVSVLDVGQGDSILLQPAGAPPILVDTGPPGDRIAAQLESAGVDRLGALVLTHDQSDHDGAEAEVLAAVPVDRVLFAVLGRDPRGLARQAGARTKRISAGSVVRSGRLRLEVLWPPPELLGTSHAGQDPNQLAVVAVARWRDFSMLLTADAEAESVPLDPGPIDVLKIAHHGSDDAGLADLLDRARPRLAVISVGAGNPFGHPTPSTLATLAEHDVPVLRTDLDGTITLDVRPDPRQGGGSKVLFPKR